jgi:inosose dehydratase
MSDALASRRRFLVSVGAAAASIGLSGPARAVARFNPAHSDLMNGAGLDRPPSGPLYPPADLSYFDNPITPAPPDIRFGYAAITWGGDNLQAIKDISELGFPGIQLRADILKDYGSKPQALRDLLASYKLEFVALSSAGINMTRGKEHDEILAHESAGRFLAAAGGRYLQVTDSGRSGGRAPAEDDYGRLGNILTEIGQRVTDLGVRLGYHNHMGTLGQSAEEVDRIMDAADPKYVKLELDIAHYFQGGGNPVAAIKSYQDRLLFLHLKDVQHNLSPSGFEFVELGRGLVDVSSVVAELHNVRFRGWAVIELDSVPQDERKAGQTAKDCAIKNKAYIEEHIGARVQP